MRDLGYEVGVTKATGDYGVDLTATTDRVRTAVQCKLQAKPVGSAAIQQVVAGAVVHQCTEVMVVSNEPYTKAAQELAKMHRCRLMDRPGLLGIERTMSEKLIR